MALAIGHAPSHLQLTEELESEFRPGRKKKKKKKNIIQKKLLIRLLPGQYQTLKNCKFNGKDYPRGSLDYILISKGFRT